jgi:hypothetical protein
MYTITEETIVENYNRFMELIEKDSRSKNLKKMYKDLDEQLSTAPASSTIHHHNAFPGGYLDHVLRVHDMSFEVAKIFKLKKGTIDFTAQELIFSTLHHDLGKLGEKGTPYYLDQDSEWHKTNLGKMYKYNDDGQYMNVTDRALYMLQSYGVTVTRNEWLAIHLSDGMYQKGNETYLMHNLHPYPFITVLPHIVHTADYLATQIEKQFTKESEKP